MDHAASQSHCEDDCCDQECHGHDHVAEAMSSAPAGTPRALKDSSSHVPSMGFDLVIQTARADAAVIRSGLPYLLQCDRTLYIVASEPNGWVVAELTFDPGPCVFVERSRARFDWPREAFGRLLSRVYVANSIENDAYDAIAASFERWLATQFVA